MLDKEKQDDYIQIRKHSSVVPLGIFVLVQIAAVVISALFYEDVLEVSPYGCSGLISSLLGGLSEGLLVLFVHKKLGPSRLLKFYVWGFASGLWTVCV